eukprot:TRINITY_DN13500_c0_g1_i1.p1 TRINITY_DN13500_c0_g1~~TRINITY_DN13500_c0_g1_i1.p1  ORF type:complete len:232 (-),score=41.63 TRINITY_DN13500_c0_g1_i1:147-842(-)
MDFAGLDMKAVPWGVDLHPSGLDLGTPMGQEPGIPIDSFPEMPHDFVQHREPTDDILSLLSDSAATSATVSASMTPWGSDDDEAAHARDAQRRANFQQQLQASMAAVAATHGQTPSAQMAALSNIAGRELTEDEKHAQKLYRNRISAKLCRARKRERYNLLEQQSKHMEQVNGQMECVIQKLLEENEMLRTTLVQVQNEGKLLRMAVDASRPALQSPSLQASTPLESLVQH